MKKFAIIVAVVLAISILSPLITVPEVDASSSSTIAETVTTGFAAYVIDYPFQRKVWYGLGHYWAIYSDAANFWYASSVDGLSWYTYGMGLPNEVGYRSSIYYDGNQTLFWVCSGEGGTVLRTGQMFSNGTMFWGYGSGLYPIEYDMYSSDYDDQCSITMDTTGKLWVVWNDYNATDSTYCVRISCSYVYANRSWINETGYPTNLSTPTGSGNETYPNVVALTSGQVYLTFGVLYSGQDTLYGRLYNGSSWGAVETIVGTGYLSSGRWGFSTIALDNDVYVGYHAFILPYYKAAIKQRYYSNSSWSGVVPLSSDLGTASSVPFLSITNDSKIYAIWNFENCTYVTLKTTSWSTPRMVLNETANYGAWTKISSVYNVDSNRLGFLFIAGKWGVYPYKIRFGTIEYSLAFDSYPSIAPPVIVNGTTYSSPASLYYLEPATYVINACSPIGYGGVWYAFNAWLVNGTTVYTNESLTLTISGNTAFTIYYLPYYPSPPSSGASYFFRGDSHIVNNVTAFQLDTTNTESAVDANETSITSGLNVSWGFRVYLLHDGGAVSELTSTYSGLITRVIDGYGYCYSTWSCPATPLVMGYDSIEIRVYTQIGAGSWTLKGTFTTPRLLEKYLKASTWMFCVYVAKSTGSTVSTFRFGDLFTADSSVTGVQFIDPNTFELMLYNLNSGNFFTFILLPYIALIGSLFYGLVLLLLIVPIYIKYHSLDVVLFMLILFGGAGGFFSLLMPISGLQVGFVVMAFAIGSLLYKMITSH
jgi:hypothetical protein